MSTKEEMQSGYMGLVVAVFMLASLIIGTIGHPILTMILSTIALIGLSLHRHMDLRNGADPVARTWVIVLWAVVTGWDILQAVGVLPVG